MGHRKKFSAMDECWNAVDDPFVKAAVTAIRWHTVASGVELFDMNFYDIIGGIYPLNNVVRHLFFLMKLRLFPEYLSVSDFYTSQMPDSDVYVNLHDFSVMYMPLLNVHAYSRIAESWSNSLSNLSFDTRLLKQLKIESFSSERCRNMLHPGLPFMEHPSDDLIARAYAMANPYLTDEYAVRYVEKNMDSFSATEFVWLCRNHSVSIGCIMEIFRTLDKGLQAAVTKLTAFQYAIENRFDFPENKISVDSLVQNSTGGHIEKYLEAHTEPKYVISAAKHPNIDGNLYNDIVVNGGDIVRGSLLSFDRTGPFHLLANYKLFPHIFNRRMAIEKFNDMFRHVLDRQLEIAKDRDEFFPKTKAGIMKAIDSFKLT